MLRQFLLCVLVKDSACFATGVQFQGICYSMFIGIIGFRFSGATGAILGLPLPTSKSFGFIATGLLGPSIYIYIYIKMYMLVTMHSLMSTYLLIIFIYIYVYYMYILYQCRSQKLHKGPNGFQPALSDSNLSFLPSQRAFSPP